jgi:hypothetical protein
VRALYTHRLRGLAAVLEFEMAMSEQALSQILSSVQFVSASDGRRLAVSDADDWNGLVEWLEELEDQRIVRNALDRLRAGPEATGAIPLETALNEL